jgi:hypothetical protein
MKKWIRGIRDEFQSTDPNKEDGTLSAIDQRYCTDQSGLMHGNKREFAKNLTKIQINCIKILCRVHEVETDITQKEKESEMQNFVYDIPTIVYLEKVRSKMSKVWQQSWKRMDRIWWWKYQKNGFFDITVEK